MKISMLFLFPIMAALQVQAAPSMTGLEIQKVEIALGGGCRDLGGKLFSLSRLLLFFV